MEKIDKQFLNNKTENQYFDRKSARIKPKDIIRHLIAFANANGGILAIGVEDDGEITGFDMQNSSKINDFEVAPLKYCPNLLNYNTEVLAIENKEVLLFQIEPSSDRVVFSSDNKVYLRIGDESITLNHDQITNLEYDKGQRYFEDVINLDTSSDDIDWKLVRNYKEMMKSQLKDIEILEARGLYNKGHLTNAGILLFAKNPTKFLPNARLRFLRYDGSRAETGKRINIIKELTFDGPIPTIISEVRNAINMQLRDFQYLNSEGKFETIPEYPEFSWFEGIVNSLTHRDYSLRGDHIRVSMYDDRLEIFSPGKLANIVSLNNMTNTRYSRNPRIARVLCEFGWVKELNEGVKRIYDEMQLYYLKAPQYSEPYNNSVLLVLENSITSRHMRKSDKLLSNGQELNFENLNEYELKIIQYLYVNMRINQKNAKFLVGRGDSFTRDILKKLCEKNIIERHGNNKNDPTQYFELKNA
ncbi:MAG: ATP-binding protein [Longicatena sp.]